jgi:N-acetylglutamate synthase-like GNAT family acetyltransferase
MDLNYSITRSTTSPEEAEFLEDRLYEFNSAEMDQDDGQLFSFWMRDEKDQVVAGITGWTWAKACEIRSLWVHSSWRKQGCGRRLLQAAEQEARSKHCEVILLSSYSFQAPEFYQKCGYTLAWKLDDFPPGQHYCFFVKRLITLNPGTLSKK